MLFNYNWRGWKYMEQSKTNPEQFHLTKTDNLTEKEKRFLIDFDNDFMFLQGKHAYDNYEAITD